MKSNITMEDYNLKPNSKVRIELPGIFKDTTGWIMGVASDVAVGCTMYIVELHTNMQIHNNGYACIVVPESYLTCII